MAADGKGLRYSAGKIMMQLIPISWIWALALVFTRGTEKYAPRNWERGMKHSDIIGPMIRHMKALLAGEMWDAETGCHHSALLAWNALAYMTYRLRGIGEDDLRDTFVEAQIELAELDRHYREAAKAKDSYASVAHHIQATATETRLKDWSGIANAPIDPEDRPFFPHADDAGGGP